jgi:hypothetical protein
LGNKKAEVFFPLLLQHVSGFLLSPKGPPSCWRAKPVIKAKAVLSVNIAAEHYVFQISFVFLLR